MKQRKRDSHVGHRSLIFKWTSRLSETPSEETETRERAEFKKKRRRRENSERERWKERHTV